MKKRRWYDVLGWSGMFLSGTGKGMERLLDDVRTRASSGRLGECQVCEAGRRVDRGGHALNIIHKPTRWLVGQVSGTCLVTATCERCSHSLIFSLVVEMKPTQAEEKEA